MTPNKPARKATSWQVAKHAGVSQSAVSRVFTPGASASAKTQAKVRQAAAELGYRPNVLARAMVSGKSHIIGLVVGYLENQFYPRVLETISNQLKDCGYHLLMFMAEPNHGTVDDVIYEILDYQVDGIITASVALSSDLAYRCREFGVPMVQFNRTQEDTNMSAVTSDNLAGGRRAAQLFIETGHKKISYIAGWEGASTQRDRENGFVSALQEAGMSLHSRYVGNFIVDDACKACREMFANDPPDAVFVANDHMAIAIMDVLRFDLGYKIPDDVSIIGYDDVPAASWPAYDLTSHTQPESTMVAATITMLLDQIENNSTSPKRVVIDGEMIERGTVKKRD